MEEDWPVEHAGPEEVAVERVRRPALGHGQPGSLQRLRRHLPAEQSATVAADVEAAEQVAVEHLEVEELGEGLGDGEVGHR